MSMNSHYAARSVPEHLEYAVKELATAVELINTSASRAVKALGNDFGVVRDFEPYPLAEALRMRNSYEPTGKPALDAAREKSLPIVERNKEVAAHNKALKDRVAALLKAIKLPQSRICISNRGLRSKYAEAGWQKSVDAIPLNCGWAELERQYRDRLDSIKHQQEEAERKRQQEVYAREKEEKRVQSRVVAKLVARDLGMEGGGEWYEVFNEILSRNKYLALADAGLKTRGNWSDGPYRVREALRSFTVEDSQDKAIKDCYESELSDWCGDGRVFRDFEWNYDRLFEMAKQQDQKLYGLYEKMRDSAVEDEW